jgi:hypothetical protein
VLALSISRIGDRKQKDSGGMKHHYKTCKGITSNENSEQNFLYSTTKQELLVYENFENRKRKTKNLCLGVLGGEEEATH